MGMPATEIRAVTLVCVIDCLRTTPQETIPRKNTLHPGVLIRDDRRSCGRSNGSLHSQAKAPDGHRRSENKLFHILIPLLNNEATLTAK